MRSIKIKGFVGSLFRVTAFILFIRRAFARTATFIVSAIKTNNDKGDKKLKIFFVVKVIFPKLLIV
jgi:hypothetical protein